ncbi:MAG TPA: cytochrome C oxidase subunit IV family protein [Candidatus Acidoferrales bacterium]|nr:cytochrome C oxidase subunit IV family protein [Candidatus Acidoferrales bacterium]
MSEHSEQSGHVGHVVPVSTYVIVFILLMMGTALTTGVAYIDLGRWNTVVALAIAVTKTMLVVLFFMHVKYAAGLTRVVILAGFFWLGIMITLSCSDELTRTWEIIPQGWNMIIPFVSRLF